MAPVSSAESRLRSAGVPSSSYRNVAEDGVTIECFPVRPDEDVLATLLGDIYGRFWDGIHFGTMIQGAASEIEVARAPDHVRMLVGCLTVDFESWHGPEPFLDREGKIKRNPDWSRLSMWDDLRLRYAGIAADDADRSSKGFVHG